MRSRAKFLSALIGCVVLCGAGAQQAGAPAALADDDVAALRAEIEDVVLAECDTNPKLGYALLKRFSALMSERIHQARQRMIEEWRPAGFA
jgi:hypothetical protein